MTGQGLYAHWMAANGEAHTHVDGWELLEETDHQIWEAFARRLNRSTGRVDIGLSASLTESIINHLLAMQHPKKGTTPRDLMMRMDVMMAEIRSLRSLLLLKETQNENAVYRGMNEEL